MIPKITYKFSGKIWKRGTTGGWHFISLPISITTEIRTQNQWMEEGWGRLKTTAKIQDLEWVTAIWYDTKHATYLLPVKASVRQKLKLQIDDNIKVSLSV